MKAWQGTVNHKQWPAFLGLLLLLLGLTGCQRAAGLSTTTVTQLTIGAPTTVHAGAPLTVTVRATPAYNGQPVQLFWFNTNGATLLTATTVAGTATFAPTTALTRVAGAVQLRAQAGTAAANATLTVVPGPAVEPVLTLVGPRSIVADEAHWTMLTALPNDQFGNAVADATSVIVRVLHPPPAFDRAPLDDVELISTQVDQLLAWARIYSRTTAGPMTMAANTETAHSPERTVMAVPGAPAPFALYTESAQPLADGRQLLTVNTAPLRDRFGNSLLDGTAVTFAVTAPDGSVRTLPAQSIDGKASVQIQAPAIPGALTVEALVLDTTSQPLTVDFSAGIGVAPIAVRALATAEQLTLVAGPLLGPLGQYIPDGSEVRFTLKLADRTAPAIAVTVPAVAGFSTATIRASHLQPGQYAVHVAAGIGEGATTVDVYEQVEHE
jgi:hypothetical protein